MSRDSAGERPLRILHIGSGFRPWRRGGLVAYTEDLIEEQLRRGDEPAYLFSGRLYPYRRGPRLKRWRRRGVPMLEVLNSPLYDHGFQPALELDEPRVERIVERVVRELEPDAVHVHELAGLPSSVLDIARVTGAPVLFTLQDYFPLCPTFKLIDSTGKVCLRRAVGEDCVATVAADKRPPGILYEATAYHVLNHSPPFRWLGQSKRSRLERRVPATITRRRSRDDSARDARTFQRRRDVNVERLNRTDRLIAMSSRVGDIYAQLGVDPARLTTRQLTLAHIERLQPRTITAPGSPITFATLGGGESAEKGARVLLDAVRLLADEAAAGKFRLVLCGHVAGSVRAEADTIPGAETRGSFSPGELDSLLDGVDVGIMPSVWEEAYGYAGMEFLAKGIPVIGNAIGGIVDYVHEGRTGWLNRSCTAEGLAAIMRGVIERPGQIEQLNATLRAERDSIVMPLSRHAAEMDALYRDTIAARVG